MIIYDPIYDGSFSSLLWIEINYGSTDDGIGFSILFYLEWILFVLNSGVLSVLKNFNKVILM